ncbi:hypothetical protein K438DRAFT_1766808 [Mycena galopus ATCC 62051]|nr:hypothetical protein K438DRAFT_1766808 [Mycena galopus ATCC 62051]
MTTNLLKNRNPNAPLGPFDGRVGAVVMIKSEAYLVTTNTDYIPTLPPLPSLNLPHERTYLELCALLNWITKFRPQKDDAQTQSIQKRSPAVPPQCIGAIVSQPAHAQELFHAGLLFWYIRPLFAFVLENILAVASITAPFALNQEKMVGQPVVHSGTNLDAKIRGMAQAAFRTPWYRDPYEDGTPSPPLSSQPPSHSPSQPVAGPSTAPSTAPASTNQYHPYPAGGSKSQDRRRSGPAKPHGATTRQSAGRDKFQLFRADEMPDAIPAWAEALLKVDRATTKSYRGVDQHYVFPEPALLISAQSEVRRQQTIRNWVLLKDLFVFRITSPDDGTPLCLKSQEWREVLCDGCLDVVPKNLRAQQTQKNSGRSVATVLGPAIHANAVDLQALSNLPELFRNYTITEIREIVWEVTEVNFRFELLSLDRRASGQERTSAVELCFAGGLLVGMPLSDSQGGLAARDLKDRHRYHVCLAKLMVDWVTDCQRPRVIQLGVLEKQSRSTEEMRDLEIAVATYYTQAFYELFGRAAVIPMRLAHVPNEY